ncbi:unnamed protein product [Chilo suppressalis]|uniref:PHD-type domain-containing protein n=1 Tax=Chilo suppressalis TaxID=168631 RepID=A0ABN8B6W0_CHISP|nr:unnamed protein product [Chilo suppressalis]
MSSKVNSKPATCAACIKPLPKNEYLQCSCCKAVYDLDCINMSSQRFHSFYALNKDRKNSWKCPECISKQPKRGNLNTPVRPTVQVQDDDASASPESPTNQGNQNITVRSKVKSPKLSTNKEIITCDLSYSDFSDIDFKQLVMEELRAIRLAVTGLTSAIESQNLRLNVLEAKMDSYETKMYACLKRLERIVASPPPCLV